MESLFLCPPDRFTDRVWAESSRLRLRRISSTYQENKLTRNHILLGLVDSWDVSLHCFWLQDRLVSIGIDRDTDTVSAILFQYRYRYRRYFSAGVTQAVSAILLGPIFTDNRYRYFLSRSSCGSATNDDNFEKNVMSCELVRHTCTRYMQIPSTAGESWFAGISKSRWYFLCCRGPSFDDLPPFHFVCVIVISVHLQFIYD